MNKIKSTIFITGYWMLARANIASAQGGLVPCSGVDCTLCDFLVLVNNVITWMIEITIVLAALFFAYGAFVIMIAGGSEEKVKQGKDTMTTAVIGVLITLGAWLILGTLLQIISGSPSKLPWTTIQCTL